LELARNYRFTAAELQEVESILEEHLDELVTAWSRFFPD
jgi:hypothetical protein